ncbi:MULTISPECIES: DMT family transporter [Caballeronia]|uniref:DMT family transporter n=1 Tax=Caballeronia TaxID=1827195 RepID=UPI00158F2F15|nr:MULTISPECIES: DMT family transporter [Caballeronia]MCG7403072.1 DMT family transporter [Caballeronia zhejiangensis]MCI1043895.1 DMT family transporter [Caballeronia zhejiangensis]
MPFIVGCALLGTIGVFLHEANADPLTATWFRCAFGLLGMSAWLISRGQTRFLRLTRSNVLWVLAASLLMVSSWALFFSAVERISAGVAIVLFHMQPMWVLLFASLWLKEAIGGQRVMAVAVAMCGLVLATGIAGHASDGSLQPAYWTGVAACLAGSLCMAGVTITARRLRDLPAGVLAWWQCAIGTLSLWIWPMQHGWPAWGMSWAWLAGLGLIHTGFAYTLMYIGMARLDTARVAVLQFIYPAVAIVIDWLVFDQRLSGAQMTGIALMSVAIGFAERVRKA